MKEYFQEYNQKPEVKEKKKEYFQRPEVKEKMKEYFQRLEVKEKRREYSQRPEIKERLKEYNQRPEVKEKKREYFQRPEVKEKKKEYFQRPEVKEKKREIKLKKNLFNFLTSIRSECLDLSKDINNIITKKLAISKATEKIIMFKNSLQNESLQVASTEDIKALEEDLLSNIETINHLITKDSLKQFIKEYFNKLKNNFESRVSKDDKPGTSGTQKVSLKRKSDKEIKYTDEEIEEMGRQIEELVSRGLDDEELREIQEEYARLVSKRRPKN